MSEAKDVRTPRRSALARAIRAVAGTPRRRIIAGSTAATVVLVLAGGAIYASTRTSDGRYRTAVAENADISETLALSGQISAATSRDVAFQTDGTVADVLVALGDSVAAGQTLATLDPAGLDSAVADATDTLARAQQQLEEDLEAQSSGVSSSRDTSATPQGGRGAATPGGQSTAPPSGGGPTTPPPDGSGDGTSTDPAVTAAIAAVTAAQKALLAQYEVATQAQDASTQALTSAQTACEPFKNATIEAGEVVPDEPAEGETGAEAEGTSGTNLDEVQALLAQCQQALADADGAQQTTSAAQSSLSDLAAELDSAVTSLQQALGSSAGTNAPTPQSGDAGEQDASTSSYGRSSAPTFEAAVHTTSSASTTRTTAALDPGQQSGGSTTVTAETILADRAAIDAAEAALAVAHRDRGFATLTSPIDGTVVSVGLADGDSVSAGSTDAVITVQAADGYVVETTVPLSRIAGVEAGQTAAVRLPAFDDDYTATVSSIGILNVSDTSTPSYTVTIALDKTDDDIRIGATAQVVVTLQTAKDVLTVPLSALSRSGSSQTVTVLRDGQTRSAQVKTGAIGTERVEITDGLSAGDVVVLADLSRSLVDDSDSSGNLSGLGGNGQNRQGFPNGFSPGDLPEGIRPPSG